MANTISIPHSLSLDCQWDKRALNVDDFYLLLFSFEVDSLVKAHDIFAFVSRGMLMHCIHYITPYIRWVAELT